MNPSLLLAPRPQGAAYESPQFLSWLDTARRYINDLSFTVSPEQATTSGTSVDFTGIPAYARVIVVMYEGVSFASAASNLVQIGPAAGIETSGYVSMSGAATTAPAVVVLTSTAGFLASNSAAAATAVQSGVMVLVLKDVTNNTWESFHVMQRTDVATIWGPMGAGVKSLAGPLTQVRLTSGTGTAVFDAGSASVGYLG